MFWEALLMTQRECGKRLGSESAGQVGFGESSSFEVLGRSGAEFRQ